MDETYVRVRGQWKYLYRSVGKTNALSVRFATRHNKLVPRNSGAE